MKKYRITSIPQYPAGGTVSQRWEAVTGLPWAEAKSRGFTTGSYDDNIALLKKLNLDDFDVSKDISNQVSVSDPEPTPASPIDPNVSQSIKNAGSFNEAFTIARKTLGTNQIFEWNGRKYGTNLKGETFNPSAEVLSAAGMNTPKVKERLQKENKELDSPYVSKTTVKLQPDLYEDWEEIKKKNDELNKKSNADKIISYKKKVAGDKNFVIVDKQKGLLHLYDPQGNQLFSSAIDLGAAISDAQTVTKYRDLNKDGKISSNEMKPSNVDWNAGNTSTGAGKFYISNIDPAGYGGLPILNMMNESQFENFKKTGNIDNVSTSFHKGYVKDDKSRISNGCIRCSKTTLDNLTKYLQNSSEVYILPEEKGNEFVYENGQLNFRVNPQYDYNTYTDQTGKTQKGQGVNRTQNTLNYKPIKLKFDEDKFRDEIFTATDIDDEDELKKTKAFIGGLQNNKQAIMKAAKINGDVYNEIAKIAFGIYGTETNYADTHSGATNALRAANKWLDPENSSSPDYESKYDFYGAKENYRSVGLTQVRWNYLNDDEKKALKEVGITSNSDFMNPSKAAIGTAVVLGVRYNQQLTADQKKDIWTYLPTKWNTRDNYADRVKNNSRFVSVYQYTGNDKPKSSTTIEKKPKPVKPYTPVYGSSIQSRNQYHPKLNPSPASSTYVKSYARPAVNIPNLYKSKAKPKPKIDYLNYFNMYNPVNYYKNLGKIQPFQRQFENGGFIELDIPINEVSNYLEQGYNVEEVPDYSFGGIFRRKKDEPIQPGSWAGVTPELVQPGEDPFALPTNTPLPEAEFVQPTLTEEEIAELQRQEKLNTKISGYKPKELKYKGLSRPKAQFVPSENMSNELLKTLNDSGFYTNKTKDGDYEVFTNKDIADLIYKKGINPNELSTKFDIGNSKELKKHFDPVYQNADLIHAKRNKEKIDKLIAQGYDKESAIAKLVRDGEGIKEGLEKHYGSYTQAAFDKNKAEVEALTSLGVANIDKLTPYQRQMYLNVKKSADDAYKKDVISAQDNVASWNPYEIQPAESTAVRNKVGAVNPITGEYEQADNRTAYEKNKDNIFKAEQALDKYNKTVGVQTDLATKILSAPNLTDADRKKFLENPDEFNKLYQSFVNWKNAPEGSGGTYIQASGLTGQNTFKTPFEITPEGAVWTPGTNRTNAPSGRVDMLDKEWITGVLGGLAFKPVMGGVGAVLDYAPVAAAPWATAGNALNAYMGYETFKPEGLIDKSMEGFEKGDKVQGWTNTAEAGLNLLPFLGPLAKGVKALKDLNTVDKAADAENLVQAGFFGDLKKGFMGESKDALVNKDMLKQFEASNYENVPEDLLAQLAAKRKATLNKGILSSSGLSPEEALVFSKNKDKINDLMANIPDAAPVSTVTAPKSGIKSWYEGVKQDFKKGWQGDNTKKSADATQNVTQSTQNVAQSTGKYMTEEELAQQMYGSNYNDLTSLSKSQVDKAFKAQPLPSGASTSATGAGSTVTNVSDDIILKNKIAQQKYGSNYDEVSSWAQGAVDKEFQLAKTAQQEAAAASQTGNAVDSTPLKDRIKAQVKPDDAYFDNSFDPNNPYVRARGRTMDYDQTVNMLEELTGRIPVLEDAGFPMYLHGSTSASLPGIIKSGGIEPLGDILNAGEVPFTGELAFGVQGMNQGNTSTAFIRTPNSALDYALGQSGKGKINIEDDLNKWFTQNREKYTAYEGMPQPEFYDDLYNKRLSQWQNLTKEEQALLNENFPVMYGIKPKTAKTVTGEKRFMIPRSDVADEMGIAGKIGMDEIPSIFVPKEQVDALQKMIGDKTKVLPMNQFIKNQRPWQQQRYLDQWKNLGYSIERLGGAIYKNGGSIDIDIDDPKLIDMLIASGYDVEQM